MRAGRLRNLCSINAPSASTDAYGEVTDSFIEIATGWAWIEPQTGTELFEGDKQIGKRQVKLTLRYAAALSAMDNGYQITTGRKTYNVLSVVNIEERNKELNILAVEVV